MCARGGVDMACGSCQCKNAKTVWCVCHLCMNFILCTFMQNPYICLKRSTRFAPAQCWLVLDLVSKYSDCILLLYYFVFLLPCVISYEKRYSLIINIVDKSSGALSAIYFAVLSILCTCVHAHTCLSVCLL